MTRTLKRTLLWTPRIFCIVFALFLSLFALDVFSEGFPFWKTILALLIHLLPTAIVLAILAVSWRWEWVGGVLFIALGTLYLITTISRMHWSAWVIISGSLYLLGGLFLTNWILRRSLHSVD